MQKSTRTKDKGRKEKGLEEGVDQDDAEDNGVNGKGGELREDMWRRIMRIGKRRSNGKNVRKMTKTGEQWDGMEF